MFICSFLFTNCNINNIDYCNDSLCIYYFLYPAVGLNYHDQAESTFLKKELEKKMKLPKYMVSALPPLAYFLQYCMTSVLILLLLYHEHIHHLVFLVQRANLHVCTAFI